MPTFQNLVLTDRQATPVAHTFVPRSIASDGSATVVESTGTPIGDNKVVITPSRTSTGRYKVAMDFLFPIVQTQTINGISTPVVVRQTNARLVFYFDQASTEAERNNAVGQIADSLGVSKTLVNDTLVKLQGIW